MKLTRKDLDWAVDEGLLRPDQADPLWAGLRGRSRDLELTPETAAYALGGVIVLAALSWFTVRAWQLWGDLTLTLLLLGYAGAFLAVGRELRFARGLRLPGDLLFLFAVALVPLILTGALRTAGLWDTSITQYDTVVLRVQIQSVVLALGTALAGAALARRAPTPLLLLPIAIALGIAVQESVLLLWGWVDLPVVDTRRTVAGVWGAVLIGTALRVDHRRFPEDWALWLHVVGVAFLWGALTAGNTDDEWVRFAYFLANVALVGASVLFRRPIYLVAGALGSLIYLVSIANDLFRDSIVFPAVLVLIGVLVILGGAAYRRKRGDLEEWARRVVPDAFVRMLPPVR